MKSILVCFCGGCGQVCDEIELGSGKSRWIDGHTYVTKYGLRWENLNRSKKICPACSRVFQAAVPDPLDRVEAGVGGTQHEATRFIADS